MPLKIITGSWGGKYPDCLVDALFRQVARNVREPFEWIVHRTARWPGWWNKLAILETPGPCLWIDVDSVVVGPLDEMIQPLEPGVDIRIGRNWAQSGHGGCQSSVMYWENSRRILAQFEDSVIDSGLWGDQEYLTQLRDRGDIVVDYFSERSLRSYKYHARPIGRIPDGASVVTFHGKPDPHEVSDKWVKDAMACSTTIPT